MTQVAPPPVLNFNLSGAEIRQLIKSIIAEERALNDEIAALKPEEQTFANVIPRIARFENANEGKIDLCGSLSHFSPDAAVREASLEAEKEYSDFNIEQSMRHDLYTVIHNIYTNTDLKTLDPQDERLLSRMERTFRRNGLHLPEDKREELKALRNRLSDLRIEFTKNYNQESSTIKFTKEELEGMDDDFLGGLKTVEEDGVQKYVLTMKYPDYLPVMKRCKREETRKAYATAFESRNSENVPLLEEAVKIRRRSAKILGYETHMDYVLDIKMAKKSEAVRNFLFDLVERMRDLALKEIEVMKELKKAEKAERGEDFDGKINAWDTSYYENILLETKYQLYPEEIKKYFSLENTVTKMLEIYEKVLGLKFVKVPKEKAVVWHPDVQVYECWDAVEDQSFSGYMYLDLHPRDNKFPHAACFSIQPSYLEDDGSRVPPIGVMVANFTKPTADKPSLLKHDEVKTLFHELGHVMHHLCSRTKYARFHGTSVENDFVEAPSQMLENWCYDVRSLKFFSSHYETGEPIPEEIIDRIIETKKVNAGLFNLRQLFFGIFDMEIHTTEDENIDTTKVYNDLREKISLIKAPEGSCGQAAFGHLMGGYDAGYYGYMWSKVFSSDMFYTKFKQDTMSPKAGYEYRKCILEPGSSKDGMDLLKDFLGREPTSDAFMKEIM